eukprot:PITA_35937
MVEEYDSIIWNSVWDVVPRPQGKSVVSSRWLYKVKQAVDGSVEKHKARFVAWGFSQVKGIDYDENFAPVARLRRRCTLRCQRVSRPLIVSRMCADSRGLYGLKQEPSDWYTRIDSYFTGLGFTKSEADVNLYHIMVEGKPLIIVLYVDDLILTGDDQLI